MPATLLPLAACSKQESYPWEEEAREKENLSCPSPTTALSKPHTGVIFVKIQPQWVCTFQGRGMWIRNIRQNKQRYKGNAKTWNSTRSAIK